jgi:hypothetical protein
MHGDIIMAKMNPESYTLSLAGMMTALSLLFLYLAAILPTARLSMYAVASLFSITLCIEQRTIYALIMFIAVSGLALLIVPNITIALPYIMFFGHYGIAKFHIEKLKDKIFAFVLKLAYFNAFLILMYFVTRAVLLDSVPDFLKDNFWIFLAVAQGVFIVYDFLYSKLASLYFNRFRKFLMKRGRR